MGLPEHHASPSIFISGEFDGLLAPKPEVLPSRHTPHKNHKRPLVKRPAHGSGGGAKACTQCGTTRTPQWREGPLGAKTLCNACGVKLVRKKRSMLEAERRAAGLAPPPKGTPLRYLLLAPAAMAELAGSPATSGVQSEPEAAPWQQHHHAGVVNSPSGRGEDDGAPMSLRRPQRRAAARAAEITAEFASTGDWPEAPASFAAARLVAKLQPQASSASDHSEQASLQGLDGAEEVAWPAPTQLAPAPSLRLLPETSAAAVDLLTMSVKAEEPAAAMGAASSGCGAVSQPVQLWRPVASVPPLVPRAVAVHEAEAVPEQAAAVALQAAQVGAAKTGFSQQLSAEDALVEHYLRAALPSKVAMLDALSSEAEEGWRLSAAADAAVAAVAKFLAKKQAAAINARSAAKVATRKLHVYLREVDEQHQIVRTHKRRRAGPV